mmetsp:Transcript_61484/g.70503  ORF Transcript_61484/g.70503 Transcript_61484/m.70503 type:complete len:91 (+) Transcript_61484:130-402(+)
MRLLRLITLIALAVLPATIFAQCDGTECPAGCCPEYNWFCCPDNIYCAATYADCPDGFSRSTTGKTSPYLALRRTKGDDNEDGSFLSESP